ncbi:MAG TPA: copper chaperone PCu(A)C [Spongiibacteraceae bacterium]
MTKFKRLLAGALMFCGANVFAGGVQIREGYVREMPPGQSTSAAFMNVVNGSDRPIAIVAAASDAAQAAELHTHSHDNGMMRMEAVKRLVIPARGHVQFAPGGYHLMLINLKRSLHAGENIGITLFDEEGKTYTAQLPVVKMVGTAQ